MTALYALYAEPDEVQRAVDNLRAAGVREPDIVVISSEPIEEYAFSHRFRETWMYLIAAAGAVVGLLFATWLTRMTELAWPLRTGNMPIVAWWPNLIVIFELTMLGAILATVATLLVTGELLRRRPALYDPQVSDGKILVGVDGPARADDVERALVAAGSPRIMRI